MTFWQPRIQYGTTRSEFIQFFRAASSSPATRLCRCSWGGQPSALAMWAACAADAADQLDEFERKWGGSYPSVVRS